MINFILCFSFAHLRILWSSASADDKVRWYYYFVSSDRLSLYRWNSESISFVPNVRLPHKYFIGRSQPTLFLLFLELFTAYHGSRYTARPQVHEYNPLLEFTSTIRYSIQVTYVRRIWRYLRKILKPTIIHHFDGFVVLMGTDTMAYAASTLSFMVKNLGKPVVFTGSQIPLCQPYKDAGKI
jgi:hypothetical protein